MDLIEKLGRVKFQNEVVISSLMNCLIHPNGKNNIHVGVSSNSIYRAGSQTNDPRLQTVEVEYVIIQYSDKAGLFSWTAFIASRLLATIFL